MSGFIKKEKKRAKQFIIFLWSKTVIDEQEVCIGFRIDHLIMKVLKIIILINYSREDNFTPLFAEKIIWPRSKCNESI